MLPEHPRVEALATHCIQPLDLAFLVEEIGVAFVEGPEAVVYEVGQLRDVVEVAALSCVERTMRLGTCVSPWRGPCAERIT